MPLAQKPSSLRSSRALEAMTPKFGTSPIRPGTGAILTLSRSRSMPAAISSPRRPVLTHGAEIGAHHQKPVHALGLCCDQLGALVTWKRRGHRVCRAADEIDLAVAQRFVGLVDGVDQLERDIEAFGFEETELDRGLGNEIGRRNLIRDCKLHDDFFPSSNQPNFSRAFLATSGLGVLLGGNFSRQCHGLQALISATECVKSPAARRSGGIAGSALESHEPVMNWIDSFGSVRVSIAHSI